MPRSYDNDYDYDRAWNNWYNQCHYEYTPDEEEYHLEECECCERERTHEERVHKAEEEGRAREEAKLHATDWYDEIKTIRNHMNRFPWLTGPEWFDARVDIFRDLFTALLGYENFLAVQPKLRTVIQEKMAECRASERALATLKDVLDQLDTLLAGLPARADYKA